MGVIVRNEIGTCLAALAKPIKFASSVFHVEAEALREGLMMAVQEGWDDIEVETDCAMLVIALEGDGEDLSLVGRIVEDCKSFVSSFHSFQFRHIYREANGVANRLALLASRSENAMSWFEETPAIIRDILYEDMRGVSRGLGFMSPLCMFPISIIIEEVVTRNPTKIGASCYSVSKNNHIYHYVVYEYHLAV